VRVVSGLEWLGEGGRGKGEGGRGDGTERKCILLVMNDKTVVLYKDNNLYR